MGTTIDRDTDDETFTVSLGCLPDGLTAGSPSSLTVTIKDVVAGLPGVSRPTTASPPLKSRPGYRRGLPPRGPARTALR